MPDRPPTPPLSPDHALDWPGRTATADAVLAAVNRRVHRRRQVRRRALAAVASLALVVSLGVTWLRQDHAPAPTPAATATLTRPTRQLLPDGSQVELNGDAQVSVDFSPTLRRVLIVRGEAHFAVTHDAARPFVVVAGGVAVRAVGTAFAVRLAPAAVNVLVTDGRVAVDRVTVDPLPLPVKPLAFVPKGARVDVASMHLAPDADAPAPAVVEVSAAELAERLAWRVPRLEFNDTPLREAVALFNRHGRLRLTLAAPALGELRVSGTVQADNAAALLLLLKADYAVDAQRRGDHEFVLSRAR